MAAEGAAFAALLGLDGSPPWQAARILVTLALAALAVWFTRRAGRTSQGATAVAAHWFQAASPATVRVWVVPNAGRTQGLAAEPGAWETRVIGFLNTALRPA